jgi:uncharacterized protein (UPF0248 family)
MKKGKLEEILSYALYADNDISRYSVIYRNYDQFVEIPLATWVELSKEENIPQHRIHQIKKNGKIVFKRQTSH